MSGKLEGKVCIVTGGGSGIGRDAVLRFLDEGASVVAADLNEDRMAETLTLAAEAAHGDRVSSVRTDVSDEGDVEAMVAHAVDKFGKLDVIFNNAGLPGALGKVDEIDTGHWDFTFGVLVRGVFLGTKYAVKQFKKQGTGGSVINTGSVAALSGGCGPIAYTACKAAVVNMTRAVAVQLAKTGIRANTVCPGGILTPLVHRGNEEAMEGHMANAQPLPIAGKGTDIAAAAVFLASDDARFITGTELVVDGGLTAAGPHIYNGEFEKAFPDGMDKGTVES